jgi:hypothetical protein
MGGSHSAKRPKVKSPSIDSSEKFLFRATGAALAGLALYGAGMVHQHYSSRPLAASTVSYETQTPSFEEAWKAAHMDRSKRPAFIKSLVDIVGKEKLGHISRVSYDPEQSQHQQYLLALAESYLPGKNITLNVARSSEGYNFYVPIIENIVATGHPSPIFIGDKFFEDAAFQNYSKPDLISVLLKGEKQAELFFSGYPNVDSTWLMQQLALGNIPTSVLTAAGDIHAAAYSKTVEGISEMRREHLENDIRQGLAIIQAQSGLSPESELFLNQTLGIYNIKVNSPSPLLPVQVPKQKKRSTYF